MQGLVFSGNRQVALRDFPDPTPGPGEVVIAIRASGICGSDLNLYRNSVLERSVICGHEPCGEIVARSPGVSEYHARLGQRVMIHHYRGCGRCWPCRMGYTQMCARAVVMGTDVHGANAPFLLAPLETLVELPDELSFAEGAAIACGTGTAFSALKRLPVSGRDTLAIFGQGPVGLAATQLAVALGARVIAVDPEAERRALEHRPELLGGGVLTPQQAHAGSVQRLEPPDSLARRVRHNVRSRIANPERHDMTVYARAHFLLRRIVQHLSLREVDAEHRVRAAL